MSLDDTRSDDPDYRPLRPRPFDYGQVACNLFAKELRRRGIWYDTSTTEPTKSGDGGWDFKIGETLIDIKRRPVGRDCLLVEERKVTSHLYVLYLDKTPVGYTDRDHVLSKAPRKWPDKIINHVVHISELWPMSKLWELLRKEKNND